MSNNATPNIQQITPFAELHRWSPPSSRVELDAKHKNLEIVEWPPREASAAWDDAAEKEAHGMQFEDWSSANEPHAAVTNTFAPAVSKQVPESEQASPRPSASPHNTEPLPSRNALLDERQQNKPTLLKLPLSRAYALSKTVNDLTELYAFLNPEVGLFTKDELYEIERVKARMTELEQAEPDVPENVDVASKLALVFNFRQIKLKEASDKGILDPQSEIGQYFVHAQAEMYQAAVEAIRACGSHYA